MEELKDEILELMEGLTDEERQLVIGYVERAKTERKT